MFTLFNLQGTHRIFPDLWFLLHRSYELSAEHFNDITLKTICQELFSNSFLSFFGDLSRS